MIRQLFILLLAAVAVSRAGNGVLFILADDYGVDSQSLYNTTAGATPPTPNINALAAQGVRFTSAWACPVCSPTRACLLTGRHGFRTGVGEAVTVAAANGLTAAEVTLPELITAHGGIQAACFGKWHLTAGGPAVIAGAPNTIGGWPHYAGATGGSLTSYTSWTKVTNGVSSASTFYATTDAVNDAVAWISARNSAGQPWLAWVAFNAPHTPFHSPPAALHSYGANPATNLLKYRAAVQAMDTEIGRLLAVINPAETTVIFMGDNGTPGQVIQDPWDITRAKDTLFDGGVRVPLIVRGPGVVRPGRTSGALVHAVDLFSTQLELAGVPVPPSLTLDAVSIVPVLADLSAGQRTRLFTDQFDQSAPDVGGRAIRDNRYKLIRLRFGSDLFFDLEADPGENTNLLAGGLAAMSATHQAHCYRLRFNLGAYTAAPAAEPAGAAAAPAGFSLTVPAVSGSTRTLWSSSDLDFWAPVAGATVSSSGASVTFTAPPPLPVRAFYSVLTETP